MTAAVCLLVKNEVADLPEWIAHHLNIGFDRIIIYDNCSDDGTTELIRRLVTSLPIDHLLWPTIDRKQTQSDIYLDCIRLTRDVHDWLLFIDADEFLVPYGTNTLHDLLRAHQNHGAVAINWMIFGSSGLHDLDGRLVMEALTRRAPLDFEVNRHVKSLIRPRQARNFINAHVFDTECGYVSIRGEAITWSNTPGLVEKSKIVNGPWGGLHHYFLRTRQHWQKRLVRGQPSGTIRDPSMFDQYDRNEEYDGAALPQAAAAKARLRQIFANAPEISVKTWLATAATENKPAASPVVTAAGADGEAHRIAEVEELPSCSGLDELTAASNGTWRVAAAEPRAVAPVRILNPQGLKLRPTPPDFFSVAPDNSPFPERIPGYPVHLSKLTGALCLRGGIILLPTGDVFAESFRHGRHTTRFTRQRIKPVGGDRLVLLSQPQEPQRVREPCFFLEGEHFPHYGHTLLEILSRLWAAEQLELADFRVIVGSNVPKFVYELLQPFGIRPENILHNTGTLLCDELWVAGQSMLVRQSISSLAEACYSRMSSVCRRGGATPDRIYVSRSRVTARQLRNEDAVEALFRKFGFVVIHPQEMAISEQLAYFANATWIAGPSGTNLFNCVFARRPGRRFILSSSNYILHTDVIINTMSRSQITYFFGRPDTGDMHASWEVAIGPLAEGIEACLAEAVETA